MAKEKAQGTEVVNPQPSQELEVPKARVLAEVFAPNGKIRVELLPEGAGGSAEGGSVDLQPLEKRVAALEKAPKGEGGGNSLGVYDKSVYTKVVNESELLSQLTSEQRGNYERLNRLCRAAFCWKNLSGIETGQDTAEKIVLEDGTVFQRLTDGKLNRNVGGLFDVYLSSFFNHSTLQKVDFLRVSLPGLNKVLVVQVESNIEDLSAIVSGQFVGRFFRLEETDYTAEKGHTEDVVSIASDAKNLITDTRTLATNAKSTADEAKSTADEAKAAADGVKAAADEAKSTLRDLKHTVDGLVSDVESHTRYISENASEIRRVERIAKGGVLESSPTSDTTGLGARLTAVNEIVADTAHKLEELKERAKDYLTKSSLRIGYTNKSLLSLTEEFYNAGVLLGDACGDLMRLEDGRFLSQIDPDKDKRDEDGEPYLEFACAQDGLVYRIYSRSRYKEFSSQFSLKIGIYGRIPGVGMYHLRNDYYGSSDDRGLDWKIVKTIPAATPVADQIKKLLGLS